MDMELPVAALLTTEEVHGRILDEWHAGRDTCEIAAGLGVLEDFVSNTLAKIRDGQRPQVTA